VHAACPDVDEDIKWRAPAFMYKGMMCGMAGFKSHCAFGFWNAAMNVPETDAMGQFGKITSLAGLPADEIVIGYVREARGSMRPVLSSDPLRADRGRLSYCPKISGSR
jgi:hypothetical protein